MSLFGSQRDVSLVRHLNRELINDIIEQQVGYYKIILSTSTVNVYGESNGTKNYQDPVLIKCLIAPDDQDWASDSVGPDVTRNVEFRFLRDDLAGNSLGVEQNLDKKGFTYNIVPEVGDIVLWSNDYYEVDSIIEDQYWVGKNPDYSYSTSTDGFGNSLSIIVRGHYTRPEKLGITQTSL